MTINEQRMAHGKHEALTHTILWHQAAQAIAIFG